MTKRGATKKLTVRAISALERVFTMNRDLLTAMSRKGVTEDDIRALCAYARKGARR